tara:strand:- start:27113 stop:27940 length:828 start_codon:yes stop_codon:yes gene_type:complete
MAKKKQVEVETPQEETVVMEQPVVKALKVEAKPKKAEFEFKDRIYYLAGNRSPLTYTPRLRGLLYFDEKLGYEREVGYAANQPSPFVDEWKGQAKKEHIIFRNGVLSVSKNKVTLQKFMSIYHPRARNSWFEVNNVANASHQIDNIELELEAMNLAKSLSLDETEAIMRAQLGSGIATMSSQEIKRDALVLARSQPSLFIDIATDDNTHLRNVGIKAIEQGIITLSSDQRHFNWKSNNRKLMTVPFDEHPYTALALWFKTDEGMEVFNQIDKRLK